jgi:VanZ family protein
VVASADEWHQTMIPSRTGTVSDVVLDTVGATVAQILIRAAQVLFCRV